MRRGVLLGWIAYGIWGLFPLYWPLLEPASPLEILAHRIVWSFCVMAVLLLVMRRWSALRALPLRTWLQVIAAAILIAVNWGVYIYAVNNGQVVEAALGYFMNPLVSVALGVLVLRERLRVLQWVAVAIAAIGVGVQTFESGSVPVIGLTLAISFALYGLVKKLVPLGPLESLTGESMVLTPVALVYIGILLGTGQSTFTDHGAGHVLLIVGTGVITVIPLLAFAGAAQRLPLTTVGLLQYITPTLQFLLGVFWAHESMPASRWAGFIVIWAALAIYTADALHHGHLRRRDVAAAASEPAVVAEQTRP